MSRYLMCLLLGLSVGGCAGKNTVAGTDKTKAEQLESSVPSWCQTTCDRIQDCAMADCKCRGDLCDCARVDDDCPEECQKEMARFTEGDDDECAEIGERFKRCIDGLSCSDFDIKGKCSLSDAEEDRCRTTSKPPIDSPPAGGGPVQDPGTGGTGSGAAPSGGGNTGSAAAPSNGGNTGTAAAPSVGGTGAGGEPVHCNSAYGTGGGAAELPASSSVVCEEGRGACTDDREYSWICARGSEGQVGCTCFVNSQVTGGFDPRSTSCPTLATVNSGCNWNLD